MKANGTREKIIKVALKLFSEKGYYPTTIKQIAKESNVNELTIFRHFGSKGNLFQLATEHSAADSKVEDILQGINELGFSEAMLVITPRIYKLYIENTKLYKVQMKLSDDEKDFVKLKLSRKIAAVCEKYFQEQKVQDNIEGDPHIMSITLINSLLGAFTVQVLSDDTMTQVHWQDIVTEHTVQFIAAYSKHSTQLLTKGD